MRSGYFDVSWFLRAARVLPVIAGAALLGGVIGGFAVFAIDSALTWEPLTREPVSPPRPDARADSQTSAVVAQTKPVRHPAADALARCTIACTSERRECGKCKQRAAASRATS
jgi:hypothetical protein